MIAAMSAETDLAFAQREPPPGPLTYEQFLEWADEETHAEWVDGQVILTSVTVSERHAAIVNGGEHVVQERQRDTRHCRVPDVAAGDSAGGVCRVSRHRSLWRRRKIGVFLCRDFPDSVALE